MKLIIDIIYIEKHFSVIRITENCKLNAPKTKKQTQGHELYSKNYSQVNFDISWNYTHVTFCNAVSLYYVMSKMIGGLSLLCRGIFMTLTNICHVAFCKNSKQLLAVKNKNKTEANKGIIKG